MVLRRAVPPLVCILFLLIGCGSGPSNTSSPIGASQPSGSVHGGQQPVVGATIQLYTVGTTGDGSAATPLLTSTVTSDANGTFTITGLYSCTNATQVYIVATGGNPGLSAANPDIALMAALGPCSALTSSTFISINELTTVAAVAALAPYMNSATAIGSSSSDTTPLANAFTVASQFVNTTTGLSPGNVPSGYTVPTNELNTLADILSACINSPGGVAGDGSLCGQLFSLTTVSPNAAPTNTIAAMLNIANNPTLNTAALYALTPPTPPFQPTLTSAPADFSVSLQGAAIPQISPSPINFLNVTVGTSSPIQTIEIQSGTLGNIRIVGDATDFFIGDFSPVQTGNCTAEGGGSSTQPCWVQVYARPFTAGVHNASVEVDYNSGSSAIYIPLSVTGIASNPTSALSSSFVNFPPTITATSSTPVPVTVSNTGSGALTVSNVAITGAVGNNFTQTNNCSSVAVNASCTIYVTFAPTATGVQSATLQLTTNGANSNAVALSGIGSSVNAQPSMWSPSLNYTIWGANQDVTLTNAGSSPMVTTSGGLNNEHTYVDVTHTCLASGASCTYVIANVPNEPLSAYTSGFSNVTGETYVSAYLNGNIITENDAYLMQNGNFSGPGTGTITFSAEPVGQSESSTIQLFNIGSGSPAASLAIGGANPGDFTVSAVQPTVSSTPSTFCPAATTGTQPCTITVTFTPTATGTRTAKISLETNGSPTGQYIYVTGTAQ